MPRTPRTDAVTTGDLGMLVRGATLACAVCGQRRGLFRRWLFMVDTCPRCGLRFEREEGHWAGAVGMNTIVTFGLILITLITTLIATDGDGVGIWLLPLALGFGVIAVVLHPVSKTLWTAVDIMMKPLDGDEVRPRDEWNPPA